MSLFATGKDISTSVMARKALDRFPDCVGKNTDDQNRLFGLAIYHCRATSSIELESYQNGVVTVNSQQTARLEVC